MRRYIAFIIILFGLSPRVFAAENSPTFKLSGDVSLLSHYVEYGLSQSDKSPALQGSFWFNFGPQFRLGLWGSNTSYTQGDDHFNLRANGDITINFSQSSSAVIVYTHSTYYNGGDHNGNILGLHLNFGDYRVLYDSFSNWEATNKASARFAFGKSSKLSGSWIWDNEAGYNMPDVSSINPYFDLRTALGTIWGPVFVEGAVTGTTAASQFDGSGDIFIILSAKKDF